ncbi:hypothetical protein G7054_g12410 [Neopestalotiopsis clavispora]|nr:hypothetical protein G7054_g12410 [Neopestalotiopsis clavispora]
MSAEKVTALDSRVTTTRDHELNEKESHSPTTSTDVEEGHGSHSLERYIKLPTIVLFGIVLLASWESFSWTFQFALLNGGPASMFYGSVLAGVGTVSIGFSLAELASIDPTVGAQYRWSANLAPAAPRFWGLRWMTVSAWCLVCAAPTSSLATMITSLIMFNKESYVPERWHTSLLMIGTMVVPLLCNLWFRKVLSSIETLAGVLHICLFIVYIAVLASGGTRNDNDFVFKTLTHDVSGWSNPGVAFCLGLLSATFSLSGVDSIIHMSTYHAHHLVLFSFATPTDSLPTGDEVKNVRTDVPRSIIVACTTNSIMLATFVLVLLFFMGPADDDLTTAPLPLIYVLYNATGSKPATNLLVALVAVVCYCATFNCFASVSRLVWAFARDKGLPFSGFFGYVHPRLRVPTNALLLVGLMVVLLSLIYIGSVTAFNAIISLQTLGVYASYILPISFLLLRKLRGPEPPYGPFKMGAWGVPVNVFALCYLLFIVTWMPFPSVLPISSNNMNYAGPIFGGIVLLALGDWFLNGRKRFQMPVKVYE